MRLRNFVRKELLLLTRDLHGLLLLFVMPALFILVMTFALQNQYSVQDQARINYFLVNQGDSAISQQFVERLNQVDNLRRQFGRDNADSIEVLRTEAEADKAKFLLVLDSEFETGLQSGESVLRLEVAPGTEPILQQLVTIQLQGLLGQLFLENQLAPLLEALDDDDLSVNTEFDTRNFMTIHSLYNGATDEGELMERPSSVQQNVPGWLLFSMFFIAIPLSNTLIAERQQGTLARLQTMGFPVRLVLLGKLIPYFLINLIQVVVMLLIGVYLVPALGGDQLLLGQSQGALVLVAMSASFAAVAYAIFIAQIANTTEQATILSGVLNIIMAAIGGVMVPRFIMPPMMQNLSDLSPMAWGLEGFLDVFLRNAGVGDVLPEAGALLLFGIVLLVLSIFLFSRRSLR